MKGSYQIVVRSNHIQYKFSVNRNITVLRGKSATGKTTLINMIDQYLQNGDNNGIEISCERPLLVLPQNNWELILKNTKDTIIFIDEGSRFVTSEDFARLAKKSSNYFVISYRDNLSNLPYSVDEIYELTNVTRGYGKVKRLYTQFERIYSEGFVKSSEINKPDYVIVEDSKAGFEFFKHYFSSFNIDCVSAKSKSKIASEILKVPQDKNVLIIADGAAFGSEIEKLIQLQLTVHLTIFLPESFEWLILSSGIIGKAEIKDVLANPSDYIESKDYFSWERFFTAFLIEQSAGTYLQYNKSKLKEEYLQKKEFNAIIGLIPDSIRL